MNKVVEVLLQDISDVSLELANLIEEVQGKGDYLAEFADLPSTLKRTCDECEDLLGGEDDA